MLVGIDGNEANLEQRVGVHQYAYELLWAIYRMRNEWRDKCRFIIYLKKPPIEDLPEEIFGWNYEIISGGGLWIVKKLTPTLIKGPRPDVFFSPSHYLPIFPLLPKVCTIHDLGYLKFSEQFKMKDFWQLKIWTAISIYISKYIITVSDSTKKDIVRHYRSSTNKVVVVHNGYDTKRFNNNINDNDVRRVLKKYKINRSYILFLSTLKPSKNLNGLLDAFAKIKSDIKNTDLPQLVVSGKKGWLYDEIFNKIEELGLEKEVIFTGFVSEEDKPAIIKGAKALVSPSFWEGFGIHILEAMACGTPVVVSKVASIPEVVGEAGIYVEPENIYSIAEGIKKVLSMNKEEYNKLIMNGIKQAQKFSWEKAARKTIPVLLKAAEK